MRIKSKKIVNDKAKQEIERGTLSRKQTAKKIRRARFRDLQVQKGNQGWGFRETSLREVEKNLGFNFKRVLQRIKRNAKNAKRTKVRVLDLGCLKGEAISQIANTFPETEAHGLSLRFFPEWKEQKRVNWHVRQAQNTKFPGNYFDFVYSYFGVTHSIEVEPGGSFKELHRIMKKDGVAIFNVEYKTYLEARSEASNLQDIIKKNGFRILNQQSKLLGPMNDPQVIFWIKKE